MQYSIHKRRRLRPPTRPKGILEKPIVERNGAGARHHRVEPAPAVATPDPDQLIASDPATIVPETASREPAYVADSRELVRIIHQTGRQTAALQRHTDAAGEAAPIAAANEPAAR